MLKGQQFVTRAELQHWLVSLVNVQEDSRKAMAEQIARLERQVEILDKRVVHLLMGAR